MLKQTIVLLGAVALAGCQGAGDQSARMTAQAPTAPELAAYAGAHRYPATQPARPLNAAAIVNRDRGIIKIYNFTNQPIQGADIWVNQAFVQHVNGIAPGSAPAVIRFADLYNGLGQQFSSQNEQVRTVRIESSGNVYTLEGPAAD
jgi:hypothetical protein